MYAVIRTGGKQYKVQPGDVIRVEKLENALGSEFSLTDVLLVGGDTTVVGQPVVQNASVTVVVTKQTKDRKVIIFKKKRRQGYRRFKTHRQPFTELFVKAISLDGKATKSETSANVVDVDKVRQDKITARSVTKRENAGKPKEAKATARPAPAKKAAPKKAKAKAKAGKTVAKKSSGKKVAKKNN
jgi:large subunit ribosomal protein L21